MTKELRKSLMPDRIRAGLSIACALAICAVTGQFSVPGAFLLFCASYAAFTAIAYLFALATGKARRAVDPEQWRGCGLFVLAWALFLAIAFYAGTRLRGVEPQWIVVVAVLLSTLVYWWLAAKVMEWLAPRERE